MSYLFFLDTNLVEITVADPKQGLRGPQSPYSLALSLKTSSRKTVQYLVTLVLCLDSFLISQVWYFDKHFPEISEKLYVRIEAR